MAPQKLAVTLCSSCQSQYLLSTCSFRPFVSSSSLPSMRSHLSILSTHATPTTPRRDLTKKHKPTSSKPRSPRTYATVADPPPSWPKSPNPTPYQVLGLHQSVHPYTKHRFYQLVKIYHPDTQSISESIKALPAAIRLERYRLIVAANDLLSDPEKRKLYDSYGVGWTSNRPSTRNDSMRYADRSWRNEPNNASHNATWEDWERWYTARNPNYAQHKSGKAPRYMSNPMFASIVVIMCMIGALSQRTRAEVEGDRYVAMKDAGDAVIGEHMRKRHLEKMGRSRDERVDIFLKEREAANFEVQRDRIGQPLPRRRDDDE